MTAAPGDPWADDVDDYSDDHCPCGGCADMAEAEAELRAEEEEIRSTYPPGSDVVIVRNAGGAVVAHHLAEDSE